MVATTGVGVGVAADGEEAKGAARGRLAPMSGKRLASRFLDWRRSGGLLNACLLGPESFISGFSVLMRGSAPLDSEPVSSLTSSSAADPPSCATLSLSAFSEPNSPR